jgi:hypothetical protein
MNFHPFFSFYHFSQITIPLIIFLVIYIFPFHTFPSSYVQNKRQLIVYISIFKEVFQDQILEI